MKSAIELFGGWGMRALFWGMGNASAFLGDGECERFFEGWGMRFSNYLEMRSRSVPEAYQAFYFAF